MPGENTNNFYTRQNDYEALSTARGSEQVEEYDAIQDGFDAVEAEVTRLGGEIANVELGEPPTFPGSIDTRWYIIDTSGSTLAYTGVLSPAPAGDPLPALPEGYTIDFIPNNNNDAPATLDVGSLEGPIPINKRVRGFNLDIEVGDLEAGVPVRLTFISPIWLIRKPQTQGVPVGTLVMFAAAIAPDGYLLCDGAAVSDTTYSDLFTVIGTTYGIGGVGTFRVPDLRGRVPVAPDDMGTGEGAASVLSANNELGNKSGSESHVLTEGELASHQHASAGNHQHATGGSHSHNASAVGDNEAEPGILSRFLTTTFAETHLAAVLQHAGHTHPATGAHQHPAAGSDGAHNNVQPYQVINYIIRY